MRAHPKYDFSCALCYRVVRNELFCRIHVADGRVTELSRSLEAHEVLKGMAGPIKRLTEDGVEHHIVFSSDTVRSALKLLGEEPLAAQAVRTASRRNGPFVKLLLQGDSLPLLLQGAVDDSSVGQVDVIYTLGNMATLASVESNKDALVQIRSQLVQCVMNAKSADVAEASLVSLALSLMADHGMDQLCASAIIHVLGCLVGRTLFLSSICHTALGCSIFAAFRSRKSRELLLKDGLLGRLPVLVSILANETSLGHDHASLLLGIQQIMALGGTRDETLDPAVPSQPLVAPAKEKGEAAERGAAAEDGSYSFVTMQIGEEDSGRGSCQECSKPLQGSCVQLGDSGHLLHDDCFCCKVCAEGFEDGKYWVAKGHYLCAEHKK